jgi:hypothetical protein
VLLLLERLCASEKDCKSTRSGLKISNTRRVPSGGSVVTLLVIPVQFKLSSNLVSMLPSSLEGPALAIGSLSTAKDGKYQSLISELEKERQVERQMLDRLMDGGTL